MSFLYLQLNVCSGVEWLKNSYGLWVGAQTQKSWATKGFAFGMLTALESFLINKVQYCYQKNLPPTFYKELTTPGAVCNSC